MVAFRLNGKPVSVDVAGDPRLLWVLREDLKLAERVPQCGYCQSGQIMSAAALLAETSRPTREKIVEHMSANICRCGTYPRIVRAIERAAREG